MNYGFYLSAAGALTNLHRQDVAANNLANLNTTAFKPDSVVTRQRLPERLEENHPMVDPQLLLEQLGGGHLVEPTLTSFSQGAITKTVNPLDLALDGEGFFVVSDGSGNPNQFRFTRDGRMTMNDRGELVMAATGRRVLDTNNQPITLDPTLEVQIRDDGGVYQNNTEVASLQITSISDPAALHKDGANLFRLDPNAGATRLPATASVKQFSTEQSAVDPIATLMAVTSTAKAVSSNIKMMQYHDDIMGRLINTVARVS